MSKPNFQSMSQKDLHDYVMAHRDEQEAFYAYVDKLHSEATWIEMPAIKSLQDLKNYPEFTKRFSNGSEPQDNAV